MWYLSYRKTQFIVYMLVTTALFGICYTKLQYLQRKDDLDRIPGLKTVKEIEQID